ncbi:alpha-1B adrenergic receptor-like [Argopecten irradians]|uniref:alpha-1B adrenergic receptor-like n=1 Tax=Argopecten irradians TaxID=31199 RepID=UPI003712BE14
MEVNGTEKNNSCNITLCSVHQEESSLESVIIRSLLFTLMSVITAVGNIFVLLVVVKLPEPRQPSRILVMNLAVADLGLGVLILPASSYNEIVSWPFGETWCIVHSVGDALLCIASLYTLCALAVDRYIGVTRPLKYNAIMTDKMAIAMVVMVWFLAWSVACPPLFGWRQPPPEDPVCLLTSHIYYIISSCIFGFLVPFIVVTCVYTKIYLVARKHICNISKNMISSDLDPDSGCGSSFSSSVSSSSQDPRVSVVKSNSRNQTAILKKVAKIRMEIRAAKTFGKILGIFIICWMPFIIAYPIGYLCNSCFIPKLAWDVVFWLGYANSMMNPFVYALSCPECRRAFSRLVWCRGKRDSQVNVLPCVPKRQGVNNSNDRF